MLRHGNTRFAVLLLMVMAVAFLWTADQGIGAASSDRVDKSATPAKAANTAVTSTTATAPPPATTAKSADKAVTGTTVKDSPPATTANAAATSATATAPPPATTASAAPQGGKGTTQDQLLKKANRVTMAEKKAAARRAAKLGLKPGAAGLGLKAGVARMAAAAPDPGGVPHYFGPYANWAYSPLPKGPVTAVALTGGGTGYSAPLVTIDDVYGTGSGAAAATAIVVGGVITAITGGVGGVDYTAPIVTITDATGTGASATASIAATTLGGALTGGIRKFIDRVPGLGPAGANALVTDSRPGGQYISVATPDSLLGNAYYVIGLVEFYERMHSDLPTKGTKLRGYVQLESPGVVGTIPLTYLDGTPINYPGTTTQVKAVDSPHYLGPTIVANSNQPVRIKFYNLLPTGLGGNLFLPVDETVMGSGFGPAGPGVANDTYKQNRAAVHLHGNNTVWISDGTPHQWITPANETTPYPNGVSVFNVPDMPNPGRPDPLCLPADPLCNPVGSGSMTIFYTNAMSARLMFYHDHAMGITRLNVYAGEAAGYVITDQVDTDMMTGSNGSGVNPSNLTVLPGIGIPLVIQDRTFVDSTTIYAQDPTWNWGTTPGTGVTGDLWYPHVYMSAQNPWDLAGANAFGRWHYGPWFINQTPVCVNGLPLGCIDVGPVPNPYYQAACDQVPPGVGCTAPWEPPQMPGTPNPSMPGEAFVDTPMVNGTVYPYLEVDAKAYRFRILNAGNDRFLNLQLYVAADKTTPTTPGSIGTALCSPTPGDPTVCTEVKMVPVSVLPANQLADTPSGIPDPTTAGPVWIQIGTEGGFLPAPVVIPQQPIGWNLNPTTFNYGNVNQHSLLLGTAERADVVVDFTAYAGQTLILYNDAPAAFPAGVSVYDYYTGDADQTDVGGAPPTQPGYGPNTRTIMQIRVSSTTGTGVDLAGLQAVFAKTATKRGVFEASQDPIIVPQAAYNSAYANTFTATAAGQYIQLHAFDKTLSPIDKTNVSGPVLAPVTFPLEMKAMHDEMGGVYDTQFGRMSGMLGLTLPSGTGVGNFYGYAAPPTDIHVGSVEGSQIGSFADGTQIWRIFHNGVDTHTIHVHLFNAQLINRVGQDGIMLAPDANELGWKDTFRVNPLEVTYIAMRPAIPTPAQVPFEVPDSIRLIDPTLPEGATLNQPPPAGWFDPAGNAITEILNHYVNFGWEYVWHCHILAHEEMDMMHSLVFAVPPTAPTGLTAVWNGLTNAQRSVTLNWVDHSIKEAGFTIQRATNSTFTTGLTSFNVAANVLAVPSTVTYVDTTVANGSVYWYKVFANGDVVGDVLTPGFPTASADSVSNTASVTVGTPTTVVPANPTLLTATVQAGPRVSLTWRDNATNETGFVVERCTVVPPATICSNFATIATPGPRNNTGNVTYVNTTVTIGTTYFYRVWAVNAIGPSLAPTNTTSATVPPVPAVPTNFRVSVGAKLANGNYPLTLTWLAVTNPTNFTIQRARNAAFTTNLNTATPGAAVRSITQNLAPNTTFYFRIRANSNISGSSAWANALPFPIRTGN